MGDAMSWVLKQGCRWKWSQNHHKKDWQSSLWRVSFYEMFKNREERKGREQLHVQWEDQQLNEMWAKQNKDVLFELT